MKLKLVQLRHMHRFPGSLCTETLSHQNAIVKNNFDLDYDQARDKVIVTYKKDPEQPPFVISMEAVLHFQPLDWKEWNVRSGPGRPPKEEAK